MIRAILADAQPVTVGVSGDKDEAEGHLGDLLGCLQSELGPLGVSGPNLFIVRGGEHDLGTAARRSYRRYARYLRKAVWVERMTGELVPVVRRSGA